METTQGDSLAAATTAAAAASSPPLASSEFSQKFFPPTDTLHTTGDLRMCEAMKRGGKKKRQVETRERRAVKEALICARGFRGNIKGGVIARCSTSTPFR